MAKKLKFKDYLRILKLIKTDPKLQARFDTNKDGVIDPDELEEAAAIIYGRDTPSESKPKTTQLGAKDEDAEKIRPQGRGVIKYLTKNLMNGEVLIYYTQVHKIIFVSSAVLFLLGIVWYFLPIEEYKMFGVYFFVFMGIYDFLLNYIRFISSEFGLTNQRVIVKTGFIRRSTMELFLKKVESVQVHQSILGRVLNYGTILITGTGGNSDPFTTICDPLKFKEQVQARLAKQRNHH